MPSPLMVVQSCHPHTFLAYLSKHIALQMSATSGGFGGQQFWELLRDSPVEREARHFFTEARSALPKRGGLPLQVSPNPCTNQPHARCCCEGVACLSFNPGTSGPPSMPTAGQLCESSPPASIHAITVCNIPCFCIACWELQPGCTG